MPVLAKLSEDLSVGVLFVRRDIMIKVSTGDLYLNGNASSPYHPNN